MFSYALFDYGSLIDGGVGGFCFERVLWLFGVVALLKWRKLLSFPSRPLS